MSYNRILPYWSLARLSQFEAVLGYFDAVSTNKPNRVNPALSESVVVKTYPLPLRR